MVVYHRTWAKKAIPILYGEGFEDNKYGFIWVANVPMQPFAFGAVLSDGPAKADGDCVIRVEIEDTALEECKKQNRYGCVYYKVPADKLNVCNKELLSTSYNGMARAEIVAGLEDLEKALTDKKEAQYLGWHIPERWESAIKLFDLAGPLP
ncbi:MAG: hypothetical protein CME33_01255 [Gimesia sp.]|uniref:hypothetical protein n=1 Tax=Gimesia sp. TaxID=2024833 RepID=UPI000C4D6D7F|nr:hypothetical protein [Gimesia sp.]MAX35178.1 hypothetical protein [Gimesia sp.]|tara:strand:- start:373 stop:825 length:453 start_codon:yes stop_codon:yes gene_type:complete